MGKPEFVDGIPCQFSRTQPEAADMWNHCSNSEKYTLTNFMWQYLLKYIYGTHELQAQDYFLLGHDSVA
jgi:hypothetical protein